MKCPRCSKDSLMLVVTTRLYEHAIPIVVSQTRCMSCGWSYDGDLKKRFFCESCGRLTMVRGKLCGFCSGVGRRSRYES